MRFCKVPTDGGLAAGTPYLDPGAQPCIACATMPCAAACPTAALTVPANGWCGYRVGYGEAGIPPERCITFRGTPCRVCADACPVGQAALTIDEGGHPLLRAEGCVGCGVCAQRLRHHAFVIPAHLRRRLSAYVPYRVDKPWGYELIWARTDRYVGKILHVKAGHVLSLQYHN